MAVEDIVYRISMYTIDRKVEVEQSSGGSSSTREHVQIKAARAVYRSTVARQEIALSLIVVTLNQKFGDAAVYENNAQCEFTTISTEFGFVVVLYLIFRLLCYRSHGLAKTLTLWR